MQDEDKTPKGRRGYVRAAFLFVFSLSAIIGTAAVFHPDSPLPNGWRPHTPLSITDELTPLTRWKLRNVASNPPLCLATIQETVAFTPASLDPPGDPNCAIATPIEVARVGQARLAPIMTDCTTALSQALSEHHGLQPTARQTLGQDIREIRHIGSYNCRKMRTSQGTSSRYSTHATAQAIDISGFSTSQGDRITLLNDWNGALPDVSEFLREAQESSCDWFGLSLGPDYNALHADHFHLQTRGWGRCR